MDKLWYYHINLIVNFGPLGKFKDGDSQCVFYAYLKINADIQQFNN